ncbi:MAG: beta-lactamase family protein [Acidobacteriota bacterium]|nr:MAG: beta-lactamase family protein [Acidobacteriota bacterium]
MHIQRLSLVASLLLVLTGFASVDAQTDKLPSKASVPAPATFRSARAKLEKRIVDGESPSFAVAVVKDGKVVWEEAVGWADREAGESASPDTSYAVASISKSITATLIDALAEKSRLKTGDRMSQYLSGDLLSSREAGEVTLAQLLGHTAGIPHFFQYEFSDDPASFYTRGAAVGRYGFIVSRPGSRYLYSNLGYSILAEVAAKAGKGEFESVMRREILRPLEMDRTTLAAWMGGKGSARGYGGDGSLLGFEFRLAPDGGAGFSSTVRDLARYSLFHLGAKVPKGMRNVPIVSILGNDGDEEQFRYDRGWGIVRSEGRTFLISDGQMSGSSSGIVLVPELGVGVVVLSNRTGGPALEVASDLLEAAVPGLGKQFAEAVERAEAAVGKASKVPYSDYSGAIGNGEAVVDVRIRFEKDKAFLTIRGEEIEMRNSGWDRGSLQLSAPVGLEKKPGEGEFRRLAFLLWPDGDKLEGFVLDELYNNRPRRGIPYKVSLKSTASR